MLLGKQLWRCASVWQRRVLATLRSGHGKASRDDCGALHRLTSAQPPNQTGSDGRCVSHDRAARRRRRHVLNRTVKAAVVVMTGALALAACGTNKTESGGGGSASCDTSKGTLTVGVIAPLTGNLAALGL